MSFNWPQARLIKIITLILSLCLLHRANAKDTCELATWPDDLVIARREDSSVTTSSASISSATQTSISATSSIFSNSSSSLTTSSSPTASPLPDLLSKITSGAISAGEINCRWTDFTKHNVNYYTCTQLAKKNNIGVEKFFLLNPEIDPDCGNIQPNSVYCVRGFIEPVRTTTGKCGPPNNNASCAGYEDLQCCNSETWTCGNSTADCADGTCYEGKCAGDAIFTTDGTCGSNYGNKQCSGKWGECCNLEGRCGSGDAFCAYGNCNSGNCTFPPAEPQTLPYFMRGNTTDGTCGAASGFSCTVIYGFCCNKNGMCGSSVADCGVGCQLDWGDCSNVTSSTSSRKTTKSSSTSKKTSSVSVTSTTSTTSRTASTTLPAISSLPSCGQTCFNAVIAQYSSFGCSIPDPSCMCSNVNFGYGIRDCSNAVCGAADASTVIAYESLYCARALATATIKVTSTAKATSSSTSTSTAKATSISTTKAAPTSTSTTKSASTSTTKVTSPSTTKPGSTSTSTIKQTSTTKAASTSTVKVTSPSTTKAGSTSTSIIKQTSTTKATSTSTVKGTSTSTVKGTSTSSTKATSSTKSTSTSSTKATSSTKSTSTTKVTSTTKATTATSVTTALSSLPSCGQTCFNNMLAQYSALGCASANAACLCKNVNFGYGIRDCSNGACGTAVASTVIAYGSAYCAAATATVKP